MKSLKLCFFLILSIVIIRPQTTYSQMTNEKEKALYEEAYQNVLDENWDEALSLFGQFISEYSDSKWTDDAHFWKCYAREKVGQSLETSFECYQNFIRSYPGSQWVDDAKSNMIRIGQALVKNGKIEYEAAIKNLQKSNNEEIALEAISALQHLGNQEALSALINIYNENASQKIKERIIFTLSQLDNNEATEKLIDIAKNDSNSKIRSEAIFWLGLNASTDEIIAFLKEIALTDSDKTMRDKAIFALSQAPDNAGIQALIDIAKKNQNAEEREKAIFWLGQKAHNDEIVNTLNDIVLNDPDKTIQKKAVFALSQAPEKRGIKADEAWLQQKTEECIKMVVTHEIGHGIGIKHHETPPGTTEEDIYPSQGAWLCPMRYPWEGSRPGAPVTAKPYDETVDILSGQYSRSNRYCTVCMSQIHISDEGY